MNIAKIGEYIRNKRKGMNLTQGELAEIIQVSHQAVSRWENGENLPDVEKLSELANLFKVSIDEIVSSGRSENNFSSNKSKYNIFSLFGNMLSVIAFVLFYILIYTTKVFWIPYLTLILLIITSILLSIIPYNNIKNKSIQDFKQVKISILVNLGILVFTTMELVQVYGRYRFLAWLILTSFISIIILYFVNLLLKNYEINQLTSNELSIKEMINKDKYIKTFLRGIIIFIIAIAFTAFLKFISFTIAGRIIEDDYNYKLIIFQYSFILVITLSFLMLILLKKQFNLLNIFSLIFFLFTVFHLLYIIFAFNKYDSVTEFSLYRMNENLIATINAILLICTIVFSVIYFLKKRKEFITGITLFMYLFLLSIILLLMIELGYYDQSSPDVAYTEGKFCFDDNFYFYYVLYAFLMLFAYDKILNKKYLQ